MSWFTKAYDKTRSYTFIKFSIIITMIRSNYLLFGEPLNIP